MEKIKTINYGELPIAKSSKFLCDNSIDDIQDCEGKYYEIRNTLNGELVAFRNN